jgi:hypothetical protein
MTKKFLYKMFIIRVWVRVWLGWVSLGFVWGLFRSGRVFLCFIAGSYMAFQRCNFRYH